MLREQEHAGDICIDHLSPSLQFHFVERGIRITAEDSGIVEQDVDTAECLQAVFDGVGNLGFVGDGS